MTTTKTIIVYDKLGTIISAYNAESGSAPMGVPYILIDLPVGVTVKSVNVTNGQPIYSTENAIISELDKINAKMDYIAMMETIDISVVCDIMEGNETTVIDSSTENHSKNYNRVYNYFMTDLWSLAAVRNAVSRWITNSEFADIVVAKDTQNSAIDTTNTIPSVSV